MNRIPHLVLVHDIATMSVLACFGSRPWHILSDNQKNIGYPSWRDNCHLSHSFCLLCLAKGVFSPVPPYCGYSNPPHSVIIMCIYLVLSSWAWYLNICIYVSILDELRQFGRVTHVFDKLLKFLTIMREKHHRRLLRFWSWGILFESRFIFPIVEVKSYYMWCIK